MQYNFTARASTAEGVYTAIMAAFEAMADDHPIRESEHLAALDQVLSILPASDMLDVVVEISGDVPVAGDVVHSTQLSIRAYMVDR